VQESNYHPSSPLPISLLISKSGHENSITLSSPPGFGLPPPISGHAIYTHGSIIRLTSKIGRKRKEKKKKKRSKPMLEGRSQQQHLLYKEGRRRGTFSRNYHSATESWTSGFVGPSNDNPPFLIFGVSWTVWATSALDACSPAFFSSFIIRASFARFLRSANVYIPNA
jgi:hypothetical protein